MLISKLGAFKTFGSDHEVWSKYTDSTNIVSLIYVLRVLNVFSGLVSSQFMFSYVLTQSLFLLLRNSLVGCT